MSMNGCFESPENHPGGLEQDEYDQHSIHFYDHCSKHSEDVIGPPGIILDLSGICPSSIILPINQPQQASSVSKLPKSPFGLIKEIRCRALDRALFKKTKQLAANQLEPPVGKNS